MSLRSKRYVRRRADLPPVPYHRWVRPFVTFVVILGIGAVIPAMYFRGADWAGIAGAAAFAAIATAFAEYLRNKKSSRKSRRKRHV